MNKIVYILKHLIVRPWHITCPLILVAGVYVLLQLFNSQAKCILIVSSSTMQAVGMVVLLSVLNNNLKKLKDSTLLDEFNKYLKEISPSVIGVVSSTANLQLQGGVACVTIVRAKLEGITEDRLKALEDEIERVRQEGLANKAEIIESVTANSKAATTRFESVEDVLRKLQANLEATVIGDYRPQIFSVLMILLGLVLSVPASFK